MQPTQDKNCTSEAVVLAVSLELSTGSWKVGLHDGRREKPTIHTVKDFPAGARLEAAVKYIETTKEKWGLDQASRVVVCFEAGQDGFWIERALRAAGYEVKVIDPASVPVERHARRAKTDRLDVIKLVNSLRAWLRGERDRMHVVRIPTEEAEAQRHLVRERGELQKEIGQHRDRIRKLLRTVGCWDSVEGDFADRLAQGQVTDYAGQALPEQLQSRLQREWDRLTTARAQLRELEASMESCLSEQARERIGRLQQLKAIGATGAKRLQLELFWRDFENRRQVGACVGLVPQPYDSGESRVDQGMSKQGNRRVRALLIELAWLWLRYQPKSAISRWFAQKTQGQQKRGRRIAIVGVARRLAIALWRYIQEGVIPPGAEFKTV